MNDQKSSVEIEDLLSSIRRLVAEDLRAPAAQPAPAPAPAPAQAAAAPEAPPPAPPKPPAAPPVVNEGLYEGPLTARPGNPPRARLTFEATPAVMIRPPAAPVSRPEPPAPQPMPMRAAAVQSAPVAPTPRVEPPAPAPAPAPVAEAAPPAVELGSPRLVLSPNLRVVQSNPPRPEARDDVLSTPPLIPRHRTMDARATAPHPSQPAFWAAETWANPAPAEPAPVQYDPAPPLRAQAPQPEPATAAMVVPDAGKAAVDSATDWADAAEAEVLAALARGLDATDTNVADAAPVAQTAPATLPAEIDADMLRDLVRDLIRDELQGALGERITRNVRKLVRAEIARAMAIRDFE